jgi:threonine/homoserine/homoserine lactone efflux protein
VIAPGTCAIYGVFAAAARDWLLASDRAMRWLNRNLAAPLRGACRPLALERA